MRNKKLLLLISVLAVTLVASVILWLVFSKNSDDSTDVTQSETEQTDPQRVEPPEDFDPNSVEIVPREESYVYTDQIISPDTVASNPNDYLDKKVTVRGWITKPPGHDTFIVTSINSTEQKALILANNGSINFNDYAPSSNDTAKSSVPVNLVGTFTVTNEAGNAEFVVESLSQ